MFQEKDLEELIIRLIKNKGYEYINGDNLSREVENVLIEEDLIKFLENRYKENEISENEIKNIILTIKGISNGDLYSSNKVSFIKMVEGYNFTRLDRSKKEFY